MTVNGFRKIAVAVPGAIEGFHMGHPDFRANGKIFATLGSPDETWGVVKVPLDLQRSLFRSEPGVFIPAPGAWGRQGSTRVLLARVDAATLRTAIRAAWEAACASKSRPPKKPQQRERT